MDNHSKAVAEFLGIDAADVEEASSVSTPEGAVVHVLLAPQGRECPHCHAENAEARGRRISNGPIEGFNSQYKKLMRASNGLKNFRRFRARLMLCSSKDFAFSPPKKGSLPRKRVGKKRGKYKKGKGDSD